MKNKIFGAASIAAAAMMVLAPVASASPTPPDTMPAMPTMPTPGVENYVSFGDSYAANPGSNDAVPSMGTCVNSARNYGSFVGQMTGLEVRNFSCNGAVAYLPHPEKNIRTQINEAVRKNALDDKTKLITISIGANDAAQGSVLPPNVQDQGFMTAMTENIRIIREHAPNAQIQLVGYPEFAAAGDAMTCPVNINGFAPRIPIPQVRDVEQALQARQLHLAQQTNITFVNMKKVANIDVGMCGKGDEHYVSAAVDTAVDQYTMVIHPTYAGSKVLAERVVANYAPGTPSHPIS